MRIESIEIKNYRIFKDARFENLSPLTLLVGSNGSGKSTLLDVFTFLKDCLTHNVAQAVALRGGFKELVSRGEEGPIAISIGFRDDFNRLATYAVDIEAHGTPPRVQRELLTIRRDGLEEEINLLSYGWGVGSALPLQYKGTLEFDPTNRHGSALNDESILALSVLGQLKEYPYFAELKRFIMEWHISDLRFESSPPNVETGGSEHLSTHGNNMAQVAKYLSDQHPTTFAKVLEKMRERVPGVNQVEALTTEDGRLVLRFQDGSFKDPFISRYASDGTIKMFAYLVLLYDPKPHPLLAVEEPENQLYPELLHELLEEFRDYARRGGQVFVSTHSPDFLNGANLDEIYWLVKENGFTTVRRASDSELLRNLVGEGDLPGALWKQGLFEGAGRR